MLQKESLNLELHKFFRRKNGETSSHCVKLNLICSLELSYTQTARNMAEYVDIACKHKGSTARK